jgi:hypothetical protein
MDQNRKAVMDKARDKRSRRAAVREDEIARGTAQPDPSPGIVGQVKDMAAGTARSVGRAAQRAARGVKDAIRGKSG